jgi:hypothetical protein
MNIYLVSVGAASYIQKKPNKYGIKIMTLCDGKSFYMVNATSYTGQVEKTTDDCVPAYCISTMRGPVHGTKRNITCNSWFPSVLLPESLPTDHKLAIVGMLRKTRDTTKLHITMRKVGTVMPACISWTTDIHSKEEQKFHAPFDIA